MKTLVPIVLTLVYGLLGLAPVSAMNLLANPHFDTDLSNWTWSPAATPIVTWDAEGEPGLGASGSAKVTNLVPNNTFAMFSECIAVTPGQDMVFGAAARATDGGGFVRAVLRIYSDPVCLTILEDVPANDFRYFIPRSTWGPSQATTRLPAGAVTVRLSVIVTPSATAPTAVNLDNAFLVAGETCAGTNQTLCLAEGRFRTSAEWRTPDGARGWANVVLLSSDSGYFWFFQPTNIELVTKVLDACDFSDRFWVFSAGLTNVDVDLEVTDTLTNETWSFENPLHQPFPPVQDTDAFATCNP